jgi:hypothetical protein
MNQNTADNPFAILGVETGASEEEVRKRYLALVKKFPPETHAEKFREIHQAYESAKDPLILARQLLDPPAKMPEWNDLIAEQKKRPPALSAQMLLALGNRADSDDNKN